MVPREKLKRQNASSLHEITWWNILEVMKNLTNKWCDIPWQEEGPKRDGGSRGMSFQAVVVFRCGDVLGNIATSNSFFFRLHWKSRVERKIRAGKMC